MQCSSRGSALHTRTLTRSTELVSLVTPSRELEVPSVVVSHCTCSQQSSSVHEISKLRRNALINKLHLDLSVVDQEEEEEDDVGSPLSLATPRRPPPDKMATLMASCVHLKIVLASLLFFVLVGVALILVCVSAASY